MINTINSINRYKPFQQANNSNKIFYIISLILLYNVKIVFSQEAIFYFKDSVVSSIGVIKNGKPDGYWKNYHPNGNLKSEGNRLNFLLDSTWIFYHENGKINKIINYKKDLKNGTFELYNPNEVLLKKINYIAGVREGETEIFQVFNTEDSSFLKEKNNYEEDYLEGVCYEFDSLENIITIKNYNKGILISKEKINRFDKQGKKHGLWRTYHINKKIKWEAEYSHGELNGKVKEFNINGGVKKIESFEKGKLLEKQSPIFFTLNKQINKDGTIEQGVIKHNKKEGTFRTYNNKGDLLVCKNFKNNILLSSGLVDSSNLKVGDWLFYYENGEIKAKGSYVKDKQNDLWYYYYSDGKNQQKGKYEMDKPVGEWLWWHHNGEIHRQERFKKGKEEGEIIEFDSLGTIITKGLYLNGRKEGAWYYYINDHKEEGFFVDDLKDGKWTYSFLNGKRSFEGNFINGIPIDKHTTYYQNGKIKETGSYANGLKDGEWKKYNFEGEVVLSIVYKNGEEFKIDGVKVKKRK